MSVPNAPQSLDAMYDPTFVLHVDKNVSGMMMFYPQVNELQFSHWVEDVLAVVENLTDGPIVLVKFYRCTHGLGKISLIYPWS